jgi:hypothetical protein
MKLSKSILVAAATFLGVSAAVATVNDALSFAHEAALPYARQGYTIREDAWGGDLGVKDQQAVTAQLFKGNDYWFCVGTDTKGAVVTVHVYDSEGHLAESETFQRPGKGLSGAYFAGARVTPKKTGTYYAIVTVEKSPAERSNWALVYGYK